MDRSQRIAQLQQMLASDPSDVFLKYGLALEIHASGDVTAGIAMLEEIRSHQPDYVPVYYQLAMYYIETNQLNAAKIVLEEGMKLTKTSDTKTYNELNALLEDIE